MFFHMYIALGRGRQHTENKSFKKISLKSDFIHNFSCFYTCIYSPGAGAENPLGSEVLYKHKPFVTLVICCKFLPINDFLTVFPK